MARKMKAAPRRVAVKKTLKRTRKEEAIVYGPKGRATEGGYMVSEDGQILAKPK